jgi:DNA-binding MarR family transcriptional regulator
VPSEAVLMEQFGVSRMTANRALRELMAEGLVTRMQGSGTFVAQLHRISSTLTIRDIHEEVAERGHVHRRACCWLERKGQRRLAPPWAAAGARVFHTILVHLENGVPIQYEDRYVNPAARLITWPPTSRRPRPRCTCWSRRRSPRPATHRACLPTAMRRKAAGHQARPLPGHDAAHGERRPTSPAWRAWCTRVRATAFREGHVPGKQ